MSISTFCHRDDEEISCFDHLLPGTIATILCHFGYVKPTSGIHRELTCLPSGEWSHQVHQCLPNCGVVSRYSTKLLIGGSFWIFFFEFSFKFSFKSSAKPTNVTEVPWHVGIYQNKEQICGGTIISERIVISAAHCFSDDTENHHEIVYENFQVAAGKVKRSLDEVDSPAAQFKDIQEVGISSL